MIYKDFIKCYSYDDYVENKEQILPETIVFNAEEGNEKLITQEYEFNFVPSGGSPNQVLVKTEDGYSWIYVKEKTEVSSLSSLPMTYSLIIAKINGTDQMLSLSGIPVAGQEIHVIVNNTGSASITITIPNGGQYVNFSEETLTVEAGGYAEINFLSDGEHIYIRSI